MTPRQEKIKLLVETSTLLAPGERQEWLEILELMNDKQLLDLENILNSEQGTANRVQKAVVEPPTLSHISNLPEGLHLGRSDKPSSSPKNTKWLDDMKLVLSEKELPAGHQAQEHLLPEHVGVDEPKPWSMTPKVKEVVKPAPETVEFDTGARVPGNWEPATSADTALLSIAIYRADGAKKIIESLQKLVRKEGYIKVLVNLEKSNLYKAYLAAGHNFLSQGQSGAAPISKEEFEEIVDILRQIQVN